MFDILTNKVYVFLGLAGISAAALGMALIAQYVFGLAPCNLCVIQRYPYGIVIALGLIGAVLVGRSQIGVNICLGLSALAMAFNSVVAFYHTGVELKWWRSVLEACNVPELDPNDILGSIEAAPVVRCDEIPWADPILGLSMANYNIAFCAALAVIAFIALFNKTKKIKSFNF